MLLRCGEAVGTNPQKHVTDVQRRCAAVTTRSAASYAATAVRQKHRLAAKSRKGPREQALLHRSLASLMVQKDQWDTYWGPKKLIFLIRDIDDATMAAAPVETCQFVATRSPWGRIGSVLYTNKRLHRTRRRFQHISANSLSSAAHKTMNYLAWLPEP